jgi:hypothetical protein
LYAGLLYLALHKLNAVLSDRYNHAMTHYNMTRVRGSVYFVGFGASNDEQMAQWFLEEGMGDRSYISLGLAAVTSLFIWALQTPAMCCFLRAESSHNMPLLPSSLGAGGPEGSHH